MRFLISLCFLFCPVFASIQEDANNEIPDSLEDRSDGKELDDEATFCEAKGGCGQQSAGYVPHSPLIPCDKVWDEFVECDAPLDLKGNETARNEFGFGCTKFGGQRFEDVQKTSVNCTVLDGIECYGNRTFLKTVPCVKYTGHYFVTTLLYSILLGFLGMDRFILGHTGTAVGKLLTLGGVGIWWLVDIVLLVTGHLMPEDGSCWMPYA